MPWMMVWLDSGSTWVRKVGSSLVNRLRALAIRSAALLSTGVMAREMTGSGTKIEVMARFRPGLQKVSPEAQSTPKRATMSPHSAPCDVLHVVGVHADEPPDLDLLAGAGVDELVALRRRLPW